MVTYTFEGVPTVIIAGNNAKEAFFAARRVSMGFIIASSENGENPQWFLTERILVRAFF